MNYYYYTERTQFQSGLCFTLIESTQIHELVFHIELWHTKLLLREIKILYKNHMQ